MVGGNSDAQEIVSSIAKGFPALNVSEGSNGETQYSLSLQILALMTGLTVLPSLVLGMTSFTRIIIVLSILRQAMGTQQTPPNQVLLAIALFLTFFIMSPTLTLINDDALISALIAGHVSAACLDVFRTEPLPPNHPYWLMPNVTVTPHIASDTRAVTAAEVIVENIVRGQKGLPFLYQVDRKAGY